MGGIPYLTPMKHTLFKTVFVFTALMFASSALASGRNSPIPQNPPANPALPPVQKPPVAIIPAPPPEPTPVIPLPAKTPPERAPQISYPISEPVTVTVTLPPPPPQPLPIPSTCGNKDPRSMEGAWQGYVDWDCDNHALHPVLWFMDDFGHCCGPAPQQMTWIWGFDGPKFKLTDGRINGAVFEGIYNGDGLLKGTVHYRGAKGCWLVTRVQVLPACGGAIPLPPPPPHMRPLPPHMILPSPARPPASPLHP